MEIVSGYYKSYDQIIYSYTDYIYHNSLKIDKMWDKCIVDLIIKNLEPNTDILDIGANIGLVTLGLIKQASDNKIQLGNVHCFECDTMTCTLLFKNVSQHTNVKLYPFALTDKQTLCETTVNTYNMGCNYIYRTIDSDNDTEYKYGHSVNGNFKQLNNVFAMGVPLDSLKYQFKNRISVIKIDVEGFELFVLKGAKDIINSNRPIIIAEVFECNFDKVLEFFREVNYSLATKVVNPDYIGQDWIFFPNM
jgi:FkbM family methyltransferase